MSKKVVLFIGGTGAQGLPAIKALLSPDISSPDASQSPYAVRVLTRDPTNHRAETLQELGCEVVQGSVKDLDSIASALKGAYGVFVNTDGFTIGEKEELFTAFRIYELARGARVKHFVWSGLDYLSKRGNFNPRYRCGHYDGKGRVNEFLKSQPSAKDTNDGDGFVWTSIASGPYMDMLFDGLFLPRPQSDGSFLWTLPLGQGHIPLIALSDFGYFTRYVFDNPSKVSGVNLEIASEWAAWPTVVQTFEKVTGKKGVYRDVSLDEYFDGLPKELSGDRPIATEVPEGMTVRQNFTGFWNAFHDDVITRDMDMLKKIHPGLHTLESWMRENEYDGTRRSIMKSMERIYNDHPPQR